ncbi:Two component system histdine kinase, HAMP domain-containing [Desulfonema magnum]|uniref:Sensory/regulatory protein RpfC n=2 Tax=Desulfonema magnum TaxID=45655 RepID=A0A975BEZ2_9BACT|nr:Two component system histdine kinase, HAMP domain-containing [Desulfonema magnum]
MSAIIFLVENQMRESVMDEFLKRGFFIARNLSAINTNYVVSYDYVKIRQSVEKIAHQSGLIYVAILLFNGDVAAYSGPRPMKEEVFSDMMIKWALRNDNESVRYRRLSDDEICDITLPILIHEERWGNVCIGLSIADMNAAILETRVRLFILGGAALLLGCIGSLFLTSRITRPVNTLVRSVEAISNREYENPIHISTRDEIGYLGTRFLSMQEMLKEHILELKSSNEKLQHEIVERKRAEEKLEAYRGYLEELVEKRTGKLRIINEQLKIEVRERERAEKASKKAMEIAERANQAKSKFLASMSHEIRTPMNGVLGMAELLLRTELNDLQRQQVEMISKSGQILLEIINDILDLSKIEAGKLELEVAGFNLCQTVEDVTRLLAERAHSKDLEMACLIHSNVPADVCGDSVRLRQILTNLMGNAIKFTKEGEIQVSVLKNKDAGDRVLLKFEVSDTGIGLTRESQKSIFEPFSQADTSTTRKYGGTGLGLTICKQLVEKMGGQLGVRSELGKGSTFWFTAYLKKQTITDKIETFPRFNLNGLSILIIDGSDTRRNILCHYLTSWKGKTVQTEKGDAAIEMLRHAVAEGKPYDVVILKRSLPGMDGLTLVRTVKSDPVIAKTRVILLISGKSYGDLEEIRQAGVSACLDIPICQSPLYSCLNTLTDSPGRPEDAEEEQMEKFHISVLLAEDNLVNQEVSKAFLETFGCDVDVANNGKEAVHAFVSGKYDLIFMDCRMPEMDGYEATRIIREKEKRIMSETEISDAMRSLHIPIIALTAHAIDSFRQRCLDAGMDDYLSKPFTRNQIGEVLKRWLSETESVREQQPLSPNQVSVEESPRLSCPVDSDILDEIRFIEKQGSPNFMRQIIGTYLRDSAKLLQAIREAVSQNDSDAIREIAHSFKSASGNMGATGLASLCKEMEDMGRANMTEAAGELLPKIEAEYERVRKALIAESENS